MKGIIIDGKITILGKLPEIKIAKNRMGRGKILIHNKVILNSNHRNSNICIPSSVKLVTGYSGTIEIGENCDLNGTCIVSYKKVKIGSFCEISSNTLIADTDFHPVDSSERLKQMSGEVYSFDQVGKAEIVIGENTWIGWNCTILKGVKIGKNSIIGANSVVTSYSEFPDNSLIAGNPAKFIKFIK